MADAVTSDMGTTLVTRNGVVIFDIETYIRKMIPLLRHVFENNNFTAV